jgi:hypothetical protein
VRDGDADAAGDDGAVQQHWLVMRLPELPRLQAMPRTTLCATSSVPPEAVQSLALTGSASHPSTI